MVGEVLLMRSVDVQYWLVPSSQALLFGLTIRIIIKVPPSLLSVDRTATSFGMCGFFEFIVLCKLEDSKSEYPGHLACRVDSQRLCTSIAYTKERTYWKIRNIAHHGCLAPAGFSVQSSSCGSRLYPNVRHRGMCLMDDH